MINRPLKPTFRIALSTAVLVTLLLCSVDAFALDGYKDRKGLYGGFGIGGGALFQDGNTGGGFLFDVQLGAGVNQMVTLGLDLDTAVHGIDGNVNWMLVPGPEANIFILDGLFIRIGLNSVLLFRDNEFEGDSFAFGFGPDFALGYEFFVNGNLALAMAIDGSYTYVAQDESHMTTVGFWMGFRFY